MQFLKSITKWFSGQHKSFFPYKEGFFQLSYLTNSPQAIIRSLDKMPFVKHAVKEKRITSNTPFMRAAIHYLEVEEGLWLMFADADYKVNVYSSRKTDKQLPADYYKLSLEITQGSGKSKVALVNGIPYSKRSWLLFKPTTSLSNCHFKGSKESTLTVFFSEKWLHEVLYKNPEFVNSNLKHFFESNANYIIWPDTELATDFFYSPLKDVLVKGSGNRQARLPEIKKQTQDFINYFITKYNSDKINEHFFEIADIDRKKVLVAERILIENIGAPFLGIEELAKRVGISPTKLKSDFKLIFGQAIFQYFREKQMACAYSILQSKTQSIKDVALLFGYENASKFSAAFKKQFEVLPSELQLLLKEEE